MKGSWLMNKVEKKLSDLFREIEGDEKRRNAYASIEGYLFQFELLLYHIMIDGTCDDAFKMNKSIDWKYYVEEIEDYSRVYDDGFDIIVQVGQIKYHSGYAGDSEYYEAVLWLYFNYLKVVKCRKISLYQSRIFHFDASGDKSSILDILNKAIAKAVNDIKSSKNTKLAGILKKINKLSKENNDNKNSRKRFSKNSCFNKVQMNRESLISNIKKLIPGTFPVHLPEEVIYSGLITKIIKDGKYGTAITLKSLNDYLTSSDFNQSKIYSDLIIDFIDYYCNIELISAVYESTRNDVVTCKYEILGKKIFEYLKSKLSNSDLRRSFLETAIYDTSFNNYVPNTEQEWEVFLQCKKQIQDYIIKISNILYSYESIEGEGVILDDWFMIKDDVWLFICPWEKRGNGIVISDFVGDSYYNYISHISKRYENAVIKPNVWYFSKKENTGLSVLNYGKDAYEYRIDITKPDNEWLAVDNVNSACFYLECLHCLKKDCFDDFSHVKDIFEMGCINA